MKGELIDRIVFSEFDYTYIDMKARFLSFGLFLKDYMSAQQLRGILKELEMRMHSTKWNNAVEIIKSEQVKPSELLGMLKKAELDRLYSGLFEEEPTSNREEISKKM